MAQTQALQQYLDLYREHADMVCAGSCAPLNNRRAAAFDALTAQGLPSQKVERYKYTNVAQALAPDFGLNLRRRAVTLDPYAAYKCRVHGMAATLRYVVGDTVLPPSPSDSILPEGVYIGSLCDYEAENPGFIGKYYHTAAGLDYDALTALNTLLVQDGMLVYLPAGTKLEQPLQLVNVLSADKDMMANRRMLVVAEEGAEGTILLCDHAFEQSKYLTTEVIEVFAKADAALEIYSIEETHPDNTRFCNTYIEQQEGSRVVYNGLTLQGGLTRNRLDVHLAGQKASISAYGAVIADGKAHVDNNILVNHDAEACESDLLYKYVLDEHSIGAFAGKVLVQQTGQKAQSQETNANLCVSDDARAFTQPMLEIYADDVKCNHGSTVGKLDETALFYMRQRGIPEAEARLLLQHAFINEVLRHIRLEPLYERLSHLVELRFKRELSSCKGCKISGSCGTSKNSDETAQKH